MKYLILIFITAMLSSCYVYRQAEVKEDQEMPTLEQQLVKDKLYQINSGGKTYKIQAVAWEGDSLSTYIDKDPEKPMKFHKNDITTVEQRVFSRGRSDALTVGAYGIVAAIILFLTQ